MTDAHPSHDDMSTPGIGRVEIPMPKFPAPDGPVVMHDDFRQIADDTIGSYKAVCMLMGLLNGDSPDDLDQNDRVGLAVLLEGTRYRLELAVEGLMTMGRELGILETNSLVDA